MYSKGKSFAMLSLLIFGLSGCASAPKDQEGLADGTSTETDHYDGDPFESFNRSMWTLNYEYLDPYLVRPVSLAYVEYTPSPVRVGVANFLSNLDEPSSMVNNIIMGNGQRAVEHFNRFWINSTFGLLGLIDIATAAGITKHDDKAFSDAIGHYGVGNGPFLMLPGYGPYTVREVTDTVDGMYVPLVYLNFWAGLGKWALEGMEKRALLVNQEAQLNSSPDPYALTRGVYLQRQAFKAEINKDGVDEEEEALLDQYLEEY
ncbi:MlaA family lipoprotein [Vibrio sp. IRLE0018]|nr:MlaA family lipoprotein [Vibrio floridensis]MCF8779597.1 MlaA family lipoprotein [Vibrio floridensis]